MALSDGRARLILGLAVGLIGVVLVGSNPLARAGGHTWSDGSTYLGMAGSLALDGDVRYDAGDLARLREDLPTGPQGLFLKRVEGNLFYAKSLLYPLLAVPFVWVFGPLGGLLALNVCAFGLALLLGHSLLRGEGLGPWASLGLTVSVFGLTVVPLYLIWLTPEILFVGLSTLALWLFGRGRTLWAAVVIGLLGYAKPPNALLALPLLLEPLLQEWMVRGSGSAWRPSSARGLIRALRVTTGRGLVVAGCVALGFLVNLAMTGERNYQGGDRKTFYGRYPFEAPGVGFDECGIWMSTEHVGPLVEGRDESDQTVKTGPVRGAEELRRSFVANLGYFWWGRFGGMFPYFPAVALGVLCFLTIGPRSIRGWLGLSTLVVSWLVYIWLIPDNWYGGGGTVGNRYFLSLVPLVLLLVPRRAAWIVAGGGGAFGAWALLPLLLSPVEHSLHPGRHTTSRAFRLFPAELTMLNDLSAFTDIWRKKRAFGDTEGDARSGRLADVDAYFLYFMDDGTFGREEGFGVRGFWLRGNGEGEVILRALERVKAFRFRLRGGGAGDTVTVSNGGKGSITVSLAPNETREILLPATAEGFPYYDTLLHVLRFRSRRGWVAPRSDARSLGSFVSISLDAERRPVAIP